MSSDLRLGVRMLWKDKAFTLTAALTLALCIGANTALFSVVHNVLLRPLSVPESDRILLTSNSYPKAGADTLGYSGVPDYYDRLRDVSAFEDQALFNARSQTIDQNGAPTRVRVMNVTPSFFRVVRVAPQLGRAFTDAEGEIGQEKKVILSYAAWQAAFGGDTQVLGRDLRIDGQPYAIVGVMPRSFSFVRPETMLWIPAAFTPQQKSDEQRHSNNWMNIGRLKPGATLQQAQAQIDALNAANLKRFPQYAELLTNAGFHSPVMRLQDFLVRDVRPILYLMWGGALFVLLIGGVNVANLVLVRSRARIRELATRLALGAGRARVARQLVTESVVLTMISAVVGLAVGYAALQFFSSLNIRDLPRANEIRLDGLVVVYTIALSAVIGLALGLIPVAGVLPANLTTVLREEGRSGTSARGARTLRRALVVAQVAFAFVLLIGAGLLFASFRQVLAVDPGFKPDGVLTASINLPRTRYADDAALVAFHNEALRGLRALPGVTAAGATDWIPLSGNNNDSVILAEGYQMKPGESVISPAVADVTPGYFEAMGATLVRGRFFDARDGASAPKVVIVDEKLAKRFWPNQDPIGRRMYRPTDLNNIIAITDKTVFFTVVGIVRDIKLHDLAEGSKTVGAYYFAMDQDTSRGMTFAVKTAGDPTALGSAVRGVLAQLDRELAVVDVQTMEQRLDQSLMTRRSPVVLSLTFGAIALLLSAVGIYGVLAYLVTQRTKEIGIRIALGSSGRAIFELVLREGLLLVAVGFVAGAIGAIALRRTLESQLFGVAATDPLVIGAVTALLVVTAALACALPARRATRIDPIVALSE
jgi:putative ABC transport system permease protein